MDTNLSYDFAVRSAQVLATITRACIAANRHVDEVVLMAVSKTQPPTALAAALAHGQFLFGENRVQEAAAKIQQLGDRPRWEMIGQLQRNKARLAVQLFHRIQSVDRLELVQALDRLCVEEARAKLPILLQINAGDDPGKAGATCAEAPTLLEAALAANRLQVDGLMTIAPLTGGRDAARRCFARLRDTRDHLAARFGVALPVLSMGMSSDLEDAIAMGSTLVRVGSALFGERPHPPM
jgi:PLP dependent protein